MPGSFADKITQQQQKKPPCPLHRSCDETSRDHCAMRSVIYCLVSVASASFLAGAPRAPLVTRRVASITLSANDDLARAAGEAAVYASSSSQKKVVAKEEDVEGQNYEVQLGSRPFGLVLAANPSERGVFISDVQADGSAAYAEASSARVGKWGERVKITKLEAGDYITDIESGKELIKVVWMELDEVIDLLQTTPSPINMRIRRGGPEPWSLERDGSGLSVEEMVQETRRRYSRLIDGEQEEALRSAFAEIKLGEQRAAREAAGTGGFESGTLKAGSRLGYELRSFAQGARDALEQIAQSVYNRALLDAKLAVTTAEYLLRRAIFDSGRVLSAASAAIAVLGPASASAAPETTGGTSAPFERMLGRLSSSRALSGASIDQRAAAMEDAATDDERREEAEKAAAARQKQMRQEASELIKEAVSGVEAWARQAAAENDAKQNGRPPPPKGDNEPDFELLTQRASLLGGEVGKSVGQALEAVQGDFAAFVRLQEDGQMPTLIEQLQEPEIIDESGGTGLRSFGRGNGRLGSFQTTGQDRARRRQSELEGKQLKLAAALGERASKDGADAFVYGVLPSAKAVGRMAARRVAESAAQYGVDLPAPKKVGSSSSAPSEGVGWVGELASEIANQYKEDLKRGSEMGPLADLVDAVSGPTKKLQDDLNALGGSVRNALQSSASQALPLQPPPLPRSIDEALPPAEESKPRGDGGGGGGFFGQTRRAVGGLQEELAQKKAKLEAIKRAQQQPASQRIFGQDEDAPAPPRDELYEMPSEPVAGVPAGWIQEVEAVVIQDGQEEPILELDEFDVVGIEDASSATFVDAVPMYDAGPSVIAADDVEVVDPNDVSTMRSAVDSFVGEAIVVADDYGGGADGEIEIEAFDVAVESEEADADDVNRERQGKVLDAVLVTAEDAIGTLFGRVKEMVTPEEAKGWKKLKSFKGKELSEKEARAARAKETLLDEVTDSIKRN